MTTVLVALIAVFGTLGGTWLNNHLNNSRDDRLDDARKKLLRRMLEDERFRWRNLSTLQHVIGADEDTTKRLLLEIEARASEDGSDVWGLISRNPFPGSN